MLRPATLHKGDIMAMDRAYIDYEKFQQLTERGVIYVTKMKKSLKYTILSDTMYQTPDGITEVRIQNVEFVIKKGRNHTAQSTHSHLLRCKKTKTHILADKRYGLGSG